MRQTITPSEMKRVETRVMRETPVTSEQLMLRAAQAVAREARALGAGRTLCVCGTGNNGGDGLLAMRLLAEDDPTFTGECWLLPGSLSADASRELHALTRAAEGRVRVVPLADELPPLPQGVVCVIDALFGTGLSRPLEGLAARVCDAVNRLGAPVVAVDIPSGLNGETGAVMGTAIHAARTVTFHRPKAGLYLGQGLNYVGELVVADIGLTAPEIAPLDDAPGMRLMSLDDLRRALPPRERVSHKGSYGRVLLWAGSEGMAGAAALCATAALRAGAGLVTVACPERVMPVLQTLCPCAMCVPLPQENPDAAWRALEQALSRVDALGAGCGLGQSANAARLMGSLLSWLDEHPLPAVLDADALNLLAAAPRRLPEGCVITPHPAEAARLLAGVTAGAWEEALATAAARMMPTTPQCCMDEIPSATASTATSADASASSIVPTTPATAQACAAASGDTPTNAPASSIAPTTPVTAQTCAAASADTPTNAPASSIAPTTPATAQACAAASADTPTNAPASSIVPTASAIPQARAATPAPSPLTPSFIADNAPATAQALCARYGASVVLKNAASVLCAGEGMALNPYGTAAMAKGGSGDVLTGVLAALLAGRAAGAYTLDDLTLMQAACALHGLAGERAERKHGQRGVLATDICQYLGRIPGEGHPPRARRRPRREAAPAPSSQPISDAPASSPGSFAVTVTIEHSVGSRDPRRPGFVYQLNMGYSQEVLANRNEWQDVVVYGVKRPLEWFGGEVVARFRLNDAPVWVAAPPALRPTADELSRALAFLGEVSQLELLRRSEISFHYHDSALHNLD